MGQGNDRCRRSIRESRCHYLLADAWQEQRHCRRTQGTTFEDTPTAKDEQEALAYSVAAVNEAGEGKRAYSNIVVTGKPYTLPMKESFANGKLSYFWLVDYDKRSRWSPFHDESSYSQDSDRGFAGFTPMMEGEWSLLKQV